jgi:hypothetical protein
VRSPLLNTLFMSTRLEKQCYPKSINEMVFIHKKMTKETTHEINRRVRDEMRDEKRDEKRDQKRDQKRDEVREASEAREVRDKRGEGEEKGRNHTIYKLCIC